MKSWTVRMPDHLFDWIREEAARQTIERKKNVSMNALVVEILSRASENKDNRMLDSGRWRDEVH